MIKVQFVLITVYQLICFVVWGYMVYLMCEQYIQNKDSSEMAYKKFGLDDDYDVYPTFSICFVGQAGATFYPLVHDKKFYNELYLHPVCAPPAKVTHHWCEIGLYQNMLLGKEDITPSASAKNVDHVTHDVLSKVERYSFMDNNREWRHNPSKSMHVSYQDSLRICITKHTEPGMGRNHTYDLFAIDPTWLASAALPTEIYVHQVGGLIQQLGKHYVVQLTRNEAAQLNENFKNTTDSAGQGVTVFHDFHIRTVEILRKRQNAVNPCNESLYDNDRQYKESVMDEVSCIPSFWKRFVNETLNTLPDCQKTDQFHQIGQMLPGTYENENLQKGTKLYTQGCNHMSVSVNMNMRNVKTVGHKLWLAFYYDADEYKEIVNNQAFTPRDLWSQIGGFVGIFLGFSCLQVTENNLFSIKIRIIGDIYYGQVKACLMFSFFFIAPRASNGTRKFRKKCHMEKPLRKKRTISQTNRTKRRENI